MNATITATWRTPTRTNTPYWMYTDILSQPGHILIAGQTRSGKSVILNSIIREMLLNAPVKNQFILIDPKRVELVEYRDFPHTIAYASEPADMINALRYAMQIVDRRYAEMQQKHIKKYDGNHVYIIIDELADLMLTCAKEVTPLLIRIGQVAAAARVHMIACTQYILSTVIPTPVRANFTVIVGLHVQKRHDSRMIIGESGCEELPQYGFCMFQTPGHDTQKVKVPFVDDATAAAEVDRLYKHWINPASLISSSDNRQAVKSWWNRRKGR